MDLETHPEVGVVSHSLIESAALIHIGKEKVAAALRRQHSRNENVVSRAILLWDI